MCGITDQRVAMIHVQVLLTYGRIILCGIVGLMRHRKWKQVGVDAHFGVRLVRWGGKV